MAKLYEYINIFTVKYVVLYKSMKIKYELMFTVALKQ